MFLIVVAHSWNLNFISFRLCFYEDNVFLVGGEKMGANSRFPIPSFLSP